MEIIVSAIVGSVSVLIAYKLSILSIILNLEMYDALCHIFMSQLINDLKNRKKSRTEWRELYKMLWFYRKPWIKKKKSEV